VREFPDEGRKCEEGNVGVGFNLQYCREEKRSELGEKLLLK
jgi:hypothetical protein